MTASAVSDMNSAPISYTVTVSSADTVAAAFDAANADAT
jgi:hypothetical protein